MLTTYKTYLSRKKQLAKNVFLLEFILETPKKINFLSGQYLILQVPQKNSLDIKRLYSIANPSVNKSSFELIVEYVSGGIGSNYLKGLKPGDKINFQGPAGVFTLKKNRKDKIFLATGTGIAPIRSMIYQIKSDRPQPEIKEVKSYLFWGLKYYKDVYLLAEFKNLSQENPNFDFLICLSREIDINNIPEKVREHFILGRVNIGLDNFLNKKTEKSLRLNKTDFYICGARLVIESLNQDLLRKGVNKNNIYFEKF